MAVNKVILVGNLGRDPELKTLDNDNAVCKFSVATSRKWTDRKGQKQEHVDWHEVVTWGKQAHNCAKYLSKGKQVYVEGRTERQEYLGEDGKKRYSHKVQAYTVQFLQGGHTPEAASPMPTRTALVRDGSLEEELPF